MYNQSLLLWDLFRKWKYWRNLDWKKNYELNLFILKEILHQICKSPFLNLSDEEFGFYKKLFNTFDLRRSFQAFISCSRSHEKAEEFCNILFLLVILRAFTSDVSPYSEYFVLLFHFNRIINTKEKYIHFIERRLFLLKYKWEQKKKH
jgi:hypothetical protein